MTTRVDNSQEQEKPWGANPEPLCTECRDRGWCADDMEGSSFHSCSHCVKGTWYRGGPGLWKTPLHPDHIAS